MGGTGSGRYSGTYVVEDCLRMSVSRCVELRLLQPGAYATGLLRWKWRHPERVLGILKIEADMRDPTAACMRLQHAIGGPESVGVVDLVATHPHLGGSRWWFVCPVTGRRTRFLYLPPGGRVFASRDGHRLGYRIQRESPEDRLLRTAQALDAKLGGSGNLLIGPPAKSTGMKWPRYWQLCRQREEAILRSLCSSSFAAEVPSLRRVIDQVKQEYPDVFTKQGASS